MKNYNLYDVRAQLKNEDAKGYLTLKNVMLITMRSILSLLMHYM